MEQEERGVEDMGEGDGYPDVDDSARQITYKTRISDLTPSGGGGSVKEALGHLQCFFPACI